MDNPPTIESAGRFKRTPACVSLGSAILPIGSFLRIPPFPGVQVSGFSEGPDTALNPTLLAERLRKSRVGGTYWAAQPEVPRGSVIVRSKAALNAAQSIALGAPIILWTGSMRPGHDCQGVTTIVGDCDPWHVLSSARALIFEVGDELEIVASLLGLSSYAFTPDEELVKSAGEQAHRDLCELSRKTFINPFTGEAMDALETVELCSFWRKLIDSNREIVGGLGFASWKQDHVAPLLWGGSDRLPFLRSTEGLKKGGSVAVWRAKTPVSLLAGLERQRALIEVEDGFLRSQGLGADCIPPLSITVDRLGEHFDPSKPSELELLLEGGGFDEQLLERARRLRHVIVEAGIGKYEAGMSKLARPAGDRRHILVPGQVEDDRSVRLGGCGLASNLELLRRVRQRNPQAYILYKPHPDVIAGHRRGAVSDDACLNFADEIVAAAPIASLIDMVDEVHVNTSLAGFEALLREKQVTTHGVPFYAGWGLTNDLGPVPERRLAKRTIDELVAATLLIYPRYVDPASGLPCPAEIIVTRLGKSENSNQGFIVGVRRLQGKMKRRLRGLVQ